MEQTRTDHDTLSFIVVVRKRYLAPHKLMTDDLLNSLLPKMTIILFYTTYATCVTPPITVADVPQCIYPWLQVLQRALCSSGGEEGGVNVVFVPTLTYVVNTYKGYETKNESKR
jgi:hypothetical protein